MERINLWKILSFRLLSIKRKAQSLSYKAALVVLVRNIRHFYKTDSYKNIILMNLRCFDLYSLLK